ncbi:hypothetical protein [Streptomyces sp. KL2]|uniref:hypothetical protein n=1 Tax=Streptomyces sp. KL2 TaxID=3050126 RepID=UPI00397AC410
MRGLNRRQASEVAGLFLGGLVMLVLTVYTAGRTLPAAGILGEEIRARVLHCETKGGGRGGTYTECAAQRVGDGGAEASPGAVKVRYEGAAGDVIAVRSTPWGSYAAVRTDLPGRAVALAAPLFLLMFAAFLTGGGVFYLRTPPNRR